MTIRWFLFVLLGVGACGKKGDSNTPSDSTATVSSVVQESPAVCVFEGISLRSEPSQKGKWLSGISMGEKLTALPETVTDSAAKMEYRKVRLSDGAEGWASAAFIIPNAKPAAIVANSFFYKRPDLSTVTDKAFEPLDFVAVTTEQGDWLEVSGKRRSMNYIEKGWIHKSGISYDEKDIAVASMVGKALNQQDMGKRYEALNAILNNPAVSASPLISFVRQMVEAAG